MTKDAIAELGNEALETEEYKQLLKRYEQYAPPSPDDD